MEVTTELSPPTEALYPGKGLWPCLPSVQTPSAITSRLALGKVDFVHLGQSPEAEAAVR
jgi:hypothetical protein